MQVGPGLQSPCCVPLGTCGRATLPFLRLRVKVTMHGDTACLSFIQQDQFRPSNCSDVRACSDIPSVSVCANGERDCGSTQRTCSCCGRCTQLDCERIAVARVHCPTLTNTTAVGRLFRGRTSNHHPPRVPVHTRCRGLTGRRTFPHRWANRGRWYRRVSPLSLGTVLRLLLCTAQVKTRRGFGR